jgi:hypothetical protein
MSQTDLAQGLMPRHFTQGPSGWGQSLSDLQDGGGGSLQDW